MSAELLERFTGIQKIRKVLLILLWVSIALIPFALVLDVFEYNLLQSIKNLSFASGDDMIRDADASDRNQLNMGLVQVAVFLATAICLFVWIFKSNKLARALGANGMQYTAAWSVGWFFIPIANLFKPYFALKEIYLSTISPISFDMEADIERQPESLNVLKLWWFFSLANRFLGQAAFRYARKAETIDELITSNALSIATDCLSVITSLMTIWLVREYSMRQRDSFDRRENEMRSDLHMAGGSVEQAAPLS